MAVTIQFSLPGGGSESLELDASPQQDHALAAQLTEHPTEKGANVTDHKVVSGARLQVQGIVTDTPTRASLQGAGAGAASRSQRAWEVLERLRADSLLCTVITTRRTYQDMVLVDLKTTSNAKQGDALYFAASFQQVLVVETLTLQLKSTEPRGKPKLELGRQVTKPADDATVRKSNLKKLKDAFVAKFLDG